MVNNDSEVDFSCFETGVVKSSSYFLLGLFLLREKVLLISCFLLTQTHSNHFVLNWKLRISLPLLIASCEFLHTQTHPLAHTHTALIILSPFISLNMCASKISISMLFVMNIEHNTWQHHTVRTHVIVLNVEHIEPACSGWNSHFGRNNCVWNEMKIEYYSYLWLAMVRNINKSARMPERITRTSTYTNTTHVWAAIKLKWSEKTRNFHSQSSHVLPLVIMFRFCSTVDAPFHCVCVCLN